MEICLGFSKNKPFRVQIRLNKGFEKLPELTIKKPEKPVERKRKSFFPHKAFDFDSWMNLLDKIGNLRVVISSLPDKDARLKLRNSLEEILTALDESELV